MTGSRQSTRTLQGLVDGAVIDAGDRLGSILLGYKPDQRELSIELLGDRIVKIMSLTVPSSTLHVHAIDEATVLRRLCNG